LKLVINFFYRSSLFKIKNELQIKCWIKFILKEKNVKINFLSIIFVGRKKIIEINTKFLKHKYETDTISFKYDTLINEADIFICPFVLRKNAILFNNSFENEMLRVLIHGILHLIGFEDSSLIKKRKMKKEEDICLEKYKRLLNE